MRCALIVLALVFTSLFGASPAQAADTWLPDFNPNTHVYVDQKIQDRVHLGSDFARLVDDKGAVNGLNVYVVVSEQGDELASGGRNDWAPNMLHGRLWDRWRYQSGFSEDRILILLYIREKDGNAGSIAVRSGSYLHGLGLDRSHFSSSSGPVMPPAKQYMRTDPQTGLLAIIDNINNEVAQAKQGGAPSTGSGVSTPWLFGWPVWVWIVIGIIIVVLIIVLLARASGSGGGSSGGGWFIASCGGSSSGSSCGGGGGGGSSSGSSCGGGGGGGGCGGGCGGGGGC